jgi:hypothetical protein
MAGERGGSVIGILIEEALKARAEAEEREQKKR